MKAETTQQTRPSHYLRASCYLLAALLVPIQSSASVLDGFLDMCKEGNPYMHCEEVIDICSQTESVAMPITDKPTEEEKKALKGCSSKKLYYGYGNSPDFVKARKCAYLEFEQGWTDDNLFYGPAILMMIYANGEGVGRNLDLALKLACEEGGAPMAEYVSHIIHLDNMGNINSAGNEKFDFCDDSQSLLMTGRCAERSAEIAKVAREDKFLKLISSWDDRQQKEFESFRSVWQSYIAVSTNEIDYYGTMGVSEGIFAKNAKQEDLLNSLNDFEHGKFPMFGDAEYVQIDRELNRIYREIQNATENDAIEFSWGSVTKGKIKTVQRAWLKYRDAWVEFAKHRYPSVAAVSWKAWLTRERVEQLKIFIEIRE